MTIEEIVKQQYFTRKKKHKEGPDFITILKGRGDKSGGTLHSDSGPYSPTYLVQNFRPATEAEILLYGNA